MPALSTLGGIVMVALALNDVFHTLLRPAATGRLTGLVFRTVWFLTRRRRAGAGASGPVTIVLTIGVWIALITLGWALIYLPHIPDGFTYSGVDPADYPPFIEALTFSMVALTTLGLGDVIPVDAVIRAVSPLEALTGFILLSASVSWFMQLYPALARRRAFAIELTSLHEAGVISGLDALSDQRAAEIVRSISTRLVEVAADLAQNAEIFYFTEKDERLSAPRAIGYALRLRDAALTAASADVRAEAQVLARVLDELARVLRERYPNLAGDSADDVFRQAAGSHGHRFDP